MAEELYAAPPEEFVERRTRAIAEARAARDRPLAKAIGELRRPTRSAWVVNRLAREAPAELGQLLDLRAALAEAQQQAAGPDLRRLSAQRHTAVEALTRQAVALAAAAGHPASEAIRQEVTQTLQAALADPAVADLVRRSRVTAAVSYGGFGPLPNAPLLVGLPSPAPASEPGQALDPQPGPVDDPQRAEAEAALRRAEQSLAAAQAEAAGAAGDAEQATRHADELSEAVQTLRHQLTETESAEQAAQQLARTARRRASDQARVVTAAEAALAEARQVVAALAD